MLKVFIGGIAVGLANIIPGVSGGTMMVILGMFNRVMSSIDGLFRRKNDHRLQDFTFLCVLGVGAVLGLVVFAKVLEVCFTNYPTQTMFCFVGMVAFSIPTLVKKEMKHDKFNIIPFAIGCIVIFGLMFFAPEQKDLVLTSFPDLDIGYLCLMVGLGFIAGGAMFMPGVSGSMILLILGYYYLFKSLLANVTSFQMDVIIPLGFMGIGIVLGIVLCGKLMKFCLDKFHGVSMNFILGLVVASTIVLIPIHAEYDVFVIVTSIVGLLLGGVLVFALEKLT
ncbi:MULTISPECIES: DUF368 domain-containing protein [unclassified Breznakia]|uniref:DUF368 domain-containing protein n=1 Tax=unclassified Breznakia TaxID=2623764 RepID=UPI002406FA42|nr:MULTISPECIES: DUF368 domain-containing protein [unclassified Breznakia]MDF9838788.1 putative membrane protein [Breznakia sp. PFB2-8]MDF9860824.1 putative membrane protein [Breznakia sp. PH5-24]